MAVAAAVLAWCGGLAHAAPRVVTDQVDARAVSCLFEMDEDPTIHTRSVVGGRCEFDIGFVSVGPHLVVARIRDLAGNESPDSVALQFARPGPPPVPAVLTLAAN